MALLQAVGVVSLNGFIFGPETETLMVRMKPIPDAAGRAITRIEYTFQIKTVIALTAAQVVGGATSTDATFDTIRQQLLTYGGEFKYTSKGMGDQLINVAGGKKDVAWGPKCQEVSFKPKAGNYAADMVLHVSYQTLDCSYAQFQFGLMEFNYKVTYDQGRDRLTRRTYAGHILIPQTRRSVNDRTLSDSADLYYEDVVPPIPFGFRREVEDRTPSEDKCRLDFTITDVQLKAALPFGVIDMDVDHDQSNTSPVQMVVKQGRISASYEIALHVPLSIAQLHFDNLWADKLLDLQLAGNGATIIPQIYTSREQTQHRRANFSLTYLLVNPLVLKDGVLGPQGFWRKVPGANHQIWAASMALANKPRGYTQDVVGPGDDVIIDLCDANPARVMAGRGPAPIGDGEAGNRVMTATCPPPELSWLWYEPMLEETDDSGRVIHKPLPSGKMPPPKPDRPSLTDYFDNPNGFNPVDQGSLADQFNKPSVTVQQRTTPTVYVTLVGWAVRLCYDIPEPVISSIGGVPVVMVNREEVEYFKTIQVPNTAIPIVVAKWRRRYVLANQPNKPVGTPSGDGDGTNVFNIQGQPDFSRGRAPVPGTSHPVLDFGKGADAGPSTLPPGFPQHS